MKTRHLILVLLVLAVPVQADEPPGGGHARWRHKRTPLFTTSQGAPLHRCRDAVFVAGGPQEILCKFAYGPWDKDLEDEDVEVFVRAEGSETWQRLGVGRTGRDRGRDQTRGIRDLDGWLVFSVPVADTLPLGQHRVRGVVRGDGAAAEATLWVLPRASPVVVFDIDGTLTTGDAEFTRELAGAAVEKSYQPKIRAGAAEVVRARVAAGALPIYVTARPNWLADRTRAWLKAEALPAGPLRLQSSVADALSKPRTRRYKERVVRGLAEVGLTVVAAYGNATTDIDAYQTAGLTPAQIFIVGPHRGEQGTTPIKDYREHLKTLSTPPD